MPLDWWDSVCSCMNYEPLHLHVLFEMLQGALDFSNNRVASAGCGPWRHLQWILSCRSTRCKQQVNQENQWKSGVKDDIVYGMIIKKWSAVAKLTGREFGPNTHWKTSMIDMDSTACEVRKVDPKMGLWCGPGMLMQNEMVEIQWNQQQDLDFKIFYGCS